MRHLIKFQPIPGQNSLLIHLIISASQDQIHKFYQDRRILEEGTPLTTGITFSWRFFLQQERLSFRSSQVHSEEVSNNLQVWSFGRRQSEDSFWRRKCDVLCQCQSSVVEIYVFKSISLPLRSKSFGLQSNLCKLLGTKNTRPFKICWFKVVCQNFEPSKYMSHAQISESSR